MSLKSTPINPFEVVMLIKIKTVKRPWHPQFARYLRLAREGTWIVIGQIMAVAGGLVGVRLLTELLSPAQYGELALGMTVAMLVNKTVMGPLSNGATRFYASANEANDLGCYLSAVRSWIFGGTAFIVLLSVFLVFCLLATDRQQWITVALAALLFATLSGYNGILNGIQNAARQRSIVALHQGVESWGRFGVAAILIFWLGASSSIALIGYALAIFLVLVSQVYFFRKAIFQPLVNRNCGNAWEKKIWKYSWPFATWGVFTWAQSASGRWALQAFASTDEVGLFAVLFQLGYYPMMFATGIVNQLMAPIFFQRACNANTRTRIASVNELSIRMVVLYLAVTLIAVLVALLFHRPIFRLLVAEKYGIVSHYLPYMVSAGGIFAIGQTVALKHMSDMRSREMVVGIITTAIMGLGCNYLFAYLYSIEGIVFAAVIFAIVYTAWMLVLVVKR